MCSRATMPFSKRTIATVETSILRPVGATPGRMQSMTRSCVKAISVSSAIWLSPAVLLIGVIVVSDGHWPMKWSR